MAFETYRDGLIRTIGGGFVLPASKHNISDWTEESILELARIVEVERFPPGASAHGKVFLLQDPREHAQPDFACFQTTPAAAGRVYCGNSIAAAGAFCPSLLDRSQDLSLNVIADGPAFRADTHAVPVGEDWQVEQSWTLSGRPTLQEIGWRGGKAVRCTGINEYLVIPHHGLNPGDIDGWVSSAGPADRLAVIDPSSDPPRVTFYNPNGRHGAAPQTGLVALALAAQEVPWVGQALVLQIVVTPRGEERLPGIRIGDEGGVVVIPPPTVVRVRWMEGHL